MAMHMHSDQRVNEALRKAESRLRKMLEIAHIPVKPSYCVKEVAVLLDTKTDAVYRLINLEVLDHIRLSKGKTNGKGKLRVDFGSLVDYIATEPEE